MENFTDPKKKSKKPSSIFEAVAPEVKGPELQIGEATPVSGLALTTVGYSPLQAQAKINREEAEYVALSIEKQKKKEEEEAKKLAFLEAQKKFDSLRVETEKAMDTLNLVESPFDKEIKEKEQQVAKIKAQKPVSITPQFGQDSFTQENSIPEAQELIQQIAELQKQKADYTLKNRNQVFKDLKSVVNEQKSSLLSDPMYLEAFQNVLDIEESYSFRYNTTLPEELANKKVQNDPNTTTVEKILSSTAYGLKRFPGALLEHSMGAVDYVMGSGQEEYLKEKLGEEKYKKYKQDKALVDAINKTDAYIHKVNTVDEIEYAKSQGLDKSDPVAYNKLLRARDITEEILQGNTDARLEDYQREWFGKILLNNRVDGVQLFENIQTNWSDTYHSLGDNADFKQFDKAVKEYVNSTGIAEEDFTDEDYANVNKKVNKDVLFRLKAQKIKEDAESLAHQTGSFMKTMVKESGHSLDMLTSFIPAKAIVTGARGAMGITKAMTLPAKAHLASKMSKALSLGLKGDNTILNAARALKSQETLTKVLRAGDSTLDLASTSLVGQAINPMFVVQRLRNAGIDQSPIGTLKDNYGVVIAGNSYKNYATKMAKENLTIYEQSLKELDSYSLSEEEKEKVKKEIETAITETNKHIEYLQDINDNQASQITRGLVDAFVENTMEMYGGKLFNKSLTTIPNLALKVPVINSISNSVSRRVGKPLIEKATKTSDWINLKTGYRDFTRKFDNVLKKYTTFGGERMIHSFPDEIKEEIMVELVNGAIDGELVKAFKTATSWDFLKKVAVQTAMIQGYMGGAGSVLKGTTMKLGDYQNRKAIELENKLAELSKANEAETNLNTKLQNQKEIERLEKELKESGTSKLGKYVRNKYDFFKKEEEIDNLIQQLRKNELNDETIEYLNSMESMSSVETKRKIELLRLEGKNQEADTLEKVQMARTIDMAINTNSVDSLVQALEKSVESMSKITATPTTLKAMENAQFMLQTATEVNNYVKSQEASLFGLGEQRVSLIAKKMTERALTQKMIQEKRQEIINLRNKGLNVSTENMYNESGASSFGVTLDEFEEFVNTFEEAFVPSDNFEAFENKLQKEVDKTSNLQLLYQAYLQKKQLQQEERELSAVIGELKNPSSEEYHFEKASQVKKEVLNTLMQSEDYKNMSLEDKISKIEEVFEKTKASKHYAELSKSKQNELKTKIALFLKLNEQINSRKNQNINQEPTQNPITNLSPLITNAIEVATQLPQAIADIVLDENVTTLTENITDDPINPDSENVDEDADSIVIDPNNLFGDEDFNETVPNNNQSEIEAKRAKIEAKKDILERKYGKRFRNVETYHLTRGSDNAYYINHEDRGEFIKSYKFQTEEQAKKYAEEENIELLTIAQGGVGFTSENKAKYDAELKALEEQKDNLEEDDDFEYTTIEEAFVRPQTQKPLDDSEKETVAKIETAFEIMLSSGNDTMFSNIDWDFTTAMTFLFAENPELVKLAYNFRGYAFLVEAYKNVFTRLGGKPDALFKGNELATFRVNLLNKMTTNGPVAISQESVATVEKIIEEKPTVENTEDPFVSTPVNEEIPVTSEGLKPRLAFSTQKYVNVLVDGKVVRKSVNTNDPNFPTDTLQDEIQADPRSLLDPDNEDFSLEALVAEEKDWDKIRISEEVIDELGNKSLISFGAWVKKNEASNPDFRNTQEFKDRLPIMVYHKGNMVAFIHNQDWFNGFNIPNPNAAIEAQQGQYTHPKDYRKVPVWEKLVLDTAKRNQDLRNNLIAKGKSKIAFSKRGDEGAYGSTDYSPELEMHIPEPLEQAVPQGELFVLEGAGVSKLGLPKEFSTGESVLLNNDSEFTNKDVKGHTYVLVRVGTKLNSLGKRVKTYRLLPVLRPRPFRQIEASTAIWLVAIHKALNGKPFEINTGYNLTKEQANIMLQGLPPAFRIDASPASLANVLNSFFKINFKNISPELQAKINKINTKRNLNDKNSIGSVDALLYTLLIEEAEKTHSRDIQSQISYINNSVEQTTNADRLRNNTSVGFIEPNGTPSKIVLSYKDYLKQSLHLIFKSYNVAKTGQPNHAIVVQPVLEIEEKGIEQIVDRKDENNVTPTPEVVPVIPPTAPTQTSQEAVAEFPVQNTENKELQEIENFIENFLNVSLDIYENNNEVSEEAFITNTPLLKATTKIGNLPIQIAGPYVQFVLAKIQKELNFRGNLSGKSITEIREKVQAEVNQYLDSIISQINDKIVILNKIENKDARTVAMLNALNDVKREQQEVKNNFDEFFVLSMKKIQRDLQIETDADLDLLLSDVEEFDKNYSQDSTEESPKSKATAKLKMLYSNIPVFDKKGNIVISRGGLPKYMSIDDVYNYVLKTVSAKGDVKGDFNEIIARLESVQDTNPVIKEVLIKIKNADAQLQNQFVVNLALHNLVSKFAMYSYNSRGELEMRFFESNSNSALLSIKETWKNNLRNSSMYNNKGEINTTYLREIKEFLNSLSQNFEEVSAEQIEKFYFYLGIDLHPKVIENLKQDILFSGSTKISLKEDFETYKSVTTTNKAFNIFSKVESFIDKAIEEPEKFSLRDTNLHEDLVGKINQIATAEVMYNPDLVSLVFRDSGKTISTMTPPKYVTDAISEILQNAEVAPEKLQEILSFSYSSKSIILEALLKNPELASQMQVQHTGLQAIQERKNKENKEKKLNKTDIIETLLFELTAFQDKKDSSVIKDTFGEEGIPMRFASMLIQTMSDKDTSLTMKTVVLDLLNYSSSFVTNQVDGQDVVELSDIILSLMYSQIVEPELKRIMKAHYDFKNTNVKNYDKAKFIFNSIPKLNSIQVNGVNLVEDIKNQVAIAKQNSKSFEELFNEMNKKYSSFLTKSLSEVVHHEAGLLDKKLKDVKPQDYVDATYKKEAGQIAKLPTNSSLELKHKVILDFVVNDMLFKAEMNKLVIGDIAQYYKASMPKDKSDILKLTTEEYINIVKESGVNLGKRLALLIAPGRKLANSSNNHPFSKYNQVFLKDPVDMASNILSLIKMFYPELEKSKVRNIERYFKIKKSYLAYLNNPNRDAENSLIEKYENTLANLRKNLSQGMPELSDYFEIEPSDAQEYTTLNEHIDILYNYGRLTEQEYKKYKEEANKGDEADFTKEDLKKLVFQPIKPVHTGIYNDVNQDIRRIVYVKSSAFPLIPQLTKGNTQLNTVRVQLEKLEKETGRNTRASYQSANKVGAMTQPINPLDVKDWERAFNGINPDNTFNGDVNKSVLVLDRNNFRIQQDTPYKTLKKKDIDVALGTQIFKLLMGDGVSNIEGEVFPYKGRMIDAKTLKQNFDNAFSSIIENQTQLLYAELGIENDGTILNRQEFLKSLQALMYREAQTRGFDEKTLRSLELKGFDFKGEKYVDFVIPLWLSPDSFKFEALLNSIVTKRIMQFRVPGNSFIAGSEVGFNQTENISDVAEANKIIYLSGWNGQELQGTTYEDGSVKSAQIMIESKFKDSKGELIDLFENFDGSEGTYISFSQGRYTLKEDMFDKELFKMFSFRTPTSSHVSGSSIEVVGILPPGTGDLMIVPKNFTKQKGLDFDVDKESAYMFTSYLDNKTGKILKYSESKLESQLKNLPYYLAYGDILNFHKQEIKSTVGEQERTKSEIKKLNLMLDRLFDMQERLEENEEQNADALASLSNSINIIYNEVLKRDATIKNLAEYLKLNQKEQKELNKLKTKEHIKLILETDKAVAKMYKDFELKAKTKLAYNDFVEAHLSVFDSPSVEIQKKINKVLSMDFAKNQAENFEILNEKNKIKELANEILEENNNILSEREKMLELEPNSIQRMTFAEAYTEAKNRQNNFNLYSSIYQKEKLDLGSIGKDAIGIYAVATTFVGLVQNSGRSNFGMQQDLEMTIGQKTSLYLAQQTMIGEERSMADFFAELENTATDNEKEQILGRVGVNLETISAHTYLVMRGFGSDTISEDTKKLLENEMQSRGKKPSDAMSSISISYGIISQPIVKKYVDKVIASKGMKGTFLNRVTEIDKTIREISKEKITYTTDIEGKNLTFRYGENGPIMPFNFSSLTGDNLALGLLGQSSDFVQSQAFMAYIMSKTEADKLTALMSSLNNNELGKSSIGASFKLSRLKNTLKRLREYSYLFGETYESEVEGSIKIGSGKNKFYLLPTTPQGKIATQGLLFYENYFSSMFPYASNKNIYTSIVETIETMGLDPDTISDEILEDIVTELKKFYYSHNETNVTNIDVEAKRYELFTDNKENNSLSSYLSKILKDKNQDKQFAKALNAIRTNDLIKRFKFKIGKSEGELSTISFEHSHMDFADPTQIYEALPNLVLMGDLPLPSKDGVNPYSTYKLVEDLIAYSFLEGGVQEANQFIKYIPIELFDSFGVQKASGATQSITMGLQRLNNKFIPELKYDGDSGINNFTVQYFQNNPDKAKVTYLKKGELQADKKSFIRGLTGINPAFYRLKVVENVNGYNKEVSKLFMRTDITTEGYLYVMIPSTNSPYVSQYNPQAVFVSPVEQEFVEVPDTRISKISEDNRNYRQDLPQIGTIKELLTYIATDANVSNSNAMLAELMFDFIDEKHTFRVAEVNTPTTSRKADGEQVITIPTYLMERSYEEILTYVMHEVMHSATYDSMLSMYNLNKETGEYELSENGQNSPEAKAFMFTYNQALNEVLQKAKELGKEDLAQQFLDNAKEIRKNNYNTNLPSIDRKAKSLLLRQERANIVSELNKDTGDLDLAKLLYSVSSITELVPNIIERTEIRSFFNSVILPKESRTLLDKIVARFKAVIKKIFPELVSNSLSERAISQALELGAKEEVYRNNTKQVSKKEMQNATLDDIYDNFSQPGPNVIEPKNNETTEEAMTEERTFSGILISSLGISESEWLSLTPQEKQKIKDCN